MARDRTVRNEHRHGIHGRVASHLVFKLHNTPHTMSAPNLACTHNRRTKFKHANARCASVRTSATGSSQAAFAVAVSREMASASLGNTSHKRMKGNASNTCRRTLGMGSSAHVSSNGSHSALKIDLENNQTPAPHASMNKYRRHHDFPRNVLCNARVSGVTSRAPQRTLPRTLIAHCVPALSGPRTEHKSAQTTSTMRQPEIAPANTHS